MLHIGLKYNRNKQVFIHVCNADACCLPASDCCCEGDITRFSPNQLNTNFIETIAHVCSANL